MNITLDEIRSKAPEGATHYEIDEDGEVWYYREDFMWWNKKWCEMPKWCDVDNLGKPLMSKE